MKAMSPSPVETVDLLDLRLLPAWVKEPAEPGRYAEAEGDHERAPRRQGRDGSQRARRRERSPRRGKDFDDRDRKKGRREGVPSSRLQRPGQARGSKAHTPDRGERSAPVTRQAPVTVRFFPYSAAFDNVVAQIMSGTVAYSLFSLARLFLDKPVGYEVCVTANEGTLLHQLGDNGVVSVDREFLERNAFRFAQRDFYRVDIVETDPIRGNFSSIARCRLSGTLLGPTNYHTYQPQLRSLYEQRFSRRMSFADYQREIEILSDSSLIERWKDEARKVTTYTTSREEPPQTFSSVAEAERHFRARYLPGLIRSVTEITIRGGSSRRLPDRILYRAIEEAWMREGRSPSKMMQELSGRFRQSGLHVFRHRRGMLFVSPIRPRAFVHEQAGVSPSVNSILEALKQTPTCTGKQLLDKLSSSDVAGAEAEPRVLALASDLRWLISEGYVIEFNDGSLDLPRVKSRQERPTVESSASQFEMTASKIAWPLQLTWPER